MEFRASRAQRRESFESDEESAVLRDDSADPSRYDCEDSDAASQSRKEDVSSEAAVSLVPTRYSVADRRISGAEWTAVV